MTNKFTLGTRLSLALSLAIASCLVANVAKAESQQTARDSVAALGQQIATLIDLDPTIRDLVASALHRAIASKENSSTPNPVTAGVPVAQPIVNGKVANPDPNPRPIKNGIIVKPQPSQSPLINGIIVRPQESRDRNRHPDRD